MGAFHKIGKELIRGIEILETITIKNQECYRARIPSDSSIFTQKDMCPPPQTATIPEGRFNHYGQSHFYLGNSEYLCVAECSHNKSCICWMQKIKIKEIDNVLDLTKEYYEYYGVSNPEILIKVI